MALNTLKAKYLAEYNACSPDDKINFASVRLSKVNVPELAKIFKAFTGKGRGDLSCRDLIMDQLRRKFPRLFLMLLGQGECDTSRGWSDR